MRDFTKSVTGYTWAMSLFGVQQIVNIFSPKKATEAFNSVSKATEDQFGQALKATFRAGDNLQKGVVDATFEVLGLGMFNGRGGGGTADVARQTGEALRQGGRAMSQVADVVGQTVQSATAAVTSATQKAAAPSPPPTSEAGGATGRQHQSWGAAPRQDS
jgi:hypothetical protein